MGTLPSRRANWTVKVKIEGQSFFLCCEEYPDGQLGGIYLDAAKHGTFTRGMCDALARSVSIALQAGCPLQKIIEALKGLNFPPNGTISGSDLVKEATSVPDWIAQELEAIYCPKIQRQGGTRAIMSGTSV